MLFTFTSNQLGTVKLVVVPYDRNHISVSFAENHVLYNKPYQLEGTLDNFIRVFENTGRLFPFIYYFSVGGNDEQGYPQAPTVQSVYIWGTVTTPTFVGGQEQGGQEQEVQLEGGDIEGGNRRRRKISLRRAQYLLASHVPNAALRRMSPKRIRKVVRSLDREYPKRRRRY